jgi:hypothetical protein
MTLTLEKPKTLLEFFMQETGKKEDEITPQEYDALLIASRHYELQIRILNRS